MKNYIIYLPEFKTSVEWASHAQRSALSIGWEMYLFEGVNGKTVAIDADWQQWNIRINQQDKKCRAMMDKPGVRGCFLSHYSLWCRCAQFNEPIGIFEHDVEFIGCAPTIDHVEDLLKLEGFNHKKPRPAGTWYEGARAYILTPNGARKLIAWIDTNGCIPADVAIGEDVVKIDLDQGNRVQIAQRHTNKQDKHTMSFTWNLDQMV